MKYWNIQCTDRTDGTKWIMRVYTRTAEEARLLAIDKLSPHVSIGRIWEAA